MATLPTTERVEHLRTVTRTPAGPVPVDAPPWNPQRGSQMPYRRYAGPRAGHVAPEERAWPHRSHRRAPLWVPVDLRDGNQALANPMDGPRKRAMFELFVAMGFKEIEVGYPAASALDYNFVRWLATEAQVPEDVTVVVFTASRPDLVERTLQSVRGLPRAVVHLCSPTAPAWREHVLGCTRDELLALIVSSAEDVARGVARQPDSDLRLQFSPEAFNVTEPDYALAVCDAVCAVWDASPDRPVTINMPTTVETTGPNVFADQVERMHLNLARRSSVILSVHPHNDRGTGVASAELALLAGAERVEGCLFGNGERTGNVDLVTLALNLFSQGVDPMLDFSDIDAVRATVEHCNQLRVPERHPYAGDLVYTAFSGTHQDGISKGMAHLEQQSCALALDKAELPWEVPYLPIDPADVGRSYEAVVRINSQSGKGGINYLLHTEYGLDLPRALRLQFAECVQLRSETEGELTSKHLWELFTSEYLEADGPLRLLGWEVATSPLGYRVVARLLAGKEVRGVEGAGGSAVAAATDALRRTGHEVVVREHVEHLVVRGTHEETAVYAECLVEQEPAWGVGLDALSQVATLKAVVSAVNRSSRGRAGTASPLRQQA